MNDNEPNWVPLRAVFPLDQCDYWMWMGRTEHNGLVIEYYKHQQTRGYLNLDHNGGAWRFEIAEDGCVPWCDEGHEHRPDVSVAIQMPVEQAIEWALS